VNRAALLAALFLLCGCTQQKPVTVVVNSSHNKEFLKQGCVDLLREYHLTSEISAQREAMFFKYPEEKLIHCIFDLDVMKRDVESQLLSALASNPQCKGVAFFQSYYAPSESTSAEARQSVGAADWRLSLDLKARAETGEVLLVDSQWMLSPKTSAGTLTNIEDATTDICTIIKRRRAQ
jgi:hypothetical protein